MGANDSTVKAVRKDGSATVVTLRGEVDLHRTPEVHRALIEACERQPERLVVNLADVSYMDSSGIGTLVEIYRRVNGYNGQLMLCGLNERVHSVFEITKLDNFFRIYPTEAEALSA